MVLWCVKMRKRSLQTVILFIALTLGACAGDSTNLISASGVWTRDDGTRLYYQTFGVAAGTVVADVSVNMLDDGSWRAYVIVGGAVASAVSSDGLSWTAEAGIRVEEGGAGMPRVFKLEDGSWRLYGNSGDGIVSWISSDGLNFTKENGYRITQSQVGETGGLTGPTMIDTSDNGYRMYFSGLPKPGPIKTFRIYSATSSDMLDWTTDDGVRIGNGSNIDQSAEHPFAVVLGDGTIRIFYYVNKITKLFTATSTDGLTFTNPTDTGLDFNDVHIVTTGEGIWRMYGGGFSEEVGGVIDSATAAPH
jgi:hypothetical protein